MDWLYVGVNKSVYLHFFVSRCSCGLLLPKSTRGDYDLVHSHQSECSVRCRVGTQPVKIITEVFNQYTV